MDAQRPLSAANSDALSVSPPIQCITIIDHLATTGFQEVTSILQLISNQLEHINDEATLFTIKAAFNAVLEMTERYQNEIQHQAGYWHTDSAAGQPAHALQSTIEFMDVLATDGFSEINAVARLALDQIEVGQEMKRVSTAIGALIKTALRYQACVSQEAASIEQPAPSNEPVPDSPTCAKSQTADIGMPIRGTGIHSSDVLGEAYRMLAFVSEVLTTGVDCEFPKVSSTEGLCYIFDDIMHRIEIADHQMMAIEQGRI